jgi:hypothetical protein
MLTVCVCSGIPFLGVPGADGNATRQPLRSGAFVNQPNNVPATLRGWFIVK